MTAQNLAYDLIATDSQSSKDAMDEGLCGTRTGKKVHVAHPGSSVTMCGHWMKFNASSYRIRVAQLGDERVVCERCATTLANGADWMRANREGC